MQDIVVRAYAQSMAVLKRAYEREGGRLDERHVKDAMRHPAVAFTRALTEAMRHGVVSHWDSDQIGAFLGQIDGPIEDDDATDSRQACEWVITYEQWARVYRPSEVAEELGVSKQRVSALKRAGKLDCVTVKGRDLFSGASVEQRKNPQNNC